MGLFDVFFSRVPKIGDSHRDCVILSTRLLRQIWGIGKSVFYHMRKISQKVVEPNWFILVSFDILIDFFKKTIFIWGCIIYSLRMTLRFLAPGGERHKFRLRPVARAWPGLNPQ